MQTPRHHYAKRVSNARQALKPQSIYCQCKGGIYKGKIVNNVSLANAICLNGHVHLGKVYALCNGYLLQRGSCFYIFPTECVLVQFTPTVRRTLARLSGYG